MGSGCALCLLSLPLLISFRFPFAFFSLSFSFCFCRPSLTSSTMLTHPSLWSDGTPLCHSFALLCALGVCITQGRLLACCGLRVPRHSFFLPFCFFSPFSLFHKSSGCGHIDRPTVCSGKSQNAHACCCQMARIATMNSPSTRTQKQQAEQESGVWVGGSL